MKIIWKLIGCAGLLLNLSVFGNVSEIFTGVTLPDDAQVTYPTENPFKEALQPVPESAFFEMEGWSLWDPSVIKVDDTYHLFCSRWPKADDHSFDTGWKRSHVIRATSPFLLGPYEFQEVVLHPTNHPWASQGVHNPKILKAGDRYLLYHLGIPGWATGFAFADSIEGPWVPVSEPVVKANNPALLLRADGSAYMVSKFKSRPVKDGKWDNHMHAMEASNVMGPYERISEGNRLPYDLELEDPDVWWANGRYNVICTDWEGKVTGIQKAVIYFTSEDGVNYELYSGIPVWSQLDPIPVLDGADRVVKRIERPDVYVNEAGEVEAILAAVGVAERGHDYIVIRPVDGFMPGSEMEAFNVKEVEQPRILYKAAQYLSEEPRTVTTDRCERSEGGAHDFYSEGDYWWPDPEDPEGPYMRHDGETNPENFIAHRTSLMRLSDMVGTLASAYLLTGDEKYAAKAVEHLDAWFVNEETRMNPTLLYGQAIKGRHTGRSIGIIDTLHLTEVARGAKLLCSSASFPEEKQTAVKTWFRDYLDWINTHPYGLREKMHPNNHGVCWSMQAAAFADLVDDEAVLSWIRNQFKTVYVPEMMNQKGGFPAELARTKPYGYSLFMIDAMAGVAQIASTPDDDLWSFELADGRGMRKGLEFIYPFIKHKEKWPEAPDVMYWDEWPVRHPSLLFAGLTFGEREYLLTWESLEADPATYEVRRNLPLRHPLLWVDTQSETTMR